MKRPLRPEELWIWGSVAATIHPLPGRAPPTPSQEAARNETPARIPPPRPHKDLRSTRAGLDAIEPNRRHRIVRERDPIAARLDLHGLTQERARAALDAFVARAWDEGYRAVLVITGKGVQGDGVLRRRVPEWLGANHMSHMVAGLSEAARHHGGQGALYVALKRKPGP